MEQDRSGPQQSARILRFERRNGRAPHKEFASPKELASHDDARTRPHAPTHLPRIDPSPVKGFEKYESGSEDADDYRHRQRTNLAAFLACVLLVAAGVWIAMKMSEVRRDQDCVLAGGKNCAGISVTGSR